MIAKTPDRRGAMLAKLRKIVRDADPEIAEDVKWKRPSNPLGEDAAGEDASAIAKHEVVPGHIRRRLPVLPDRASLS